MSLLTYQHVIAKPYIAIAKPGYFTQFITWCTAQEEKRLLWLGIGLSVHGCILTPITVMAILIFNTNIELVTLTAAMLAMTSVLVVNLAALPTKITIPVFVLSVLVDIAIIAGVFF